MLTEREASGTAPRPLILLTGPTGYIGGRLLQELQRAGHRVRCMARRPEFLRPRVSPSTEIVAADILDPRSLSEALAGVDIVYYLVHSMSSGGSFEEKDRQGAQNFAAAASAAGVKRIIYMGGLGRDNEALSPHLRSRHEVGRILRGTGVPVLELRASIVIGAGSASFELIRSLVDRLPVMVTPQWASMTAQPIAMDDLLRYLLASLVVPVTGSPVYEIGGADQVSYADIMRAYARLRGRRIIMIRVPVLTPFLSSLWLRVVTPLYARVGSALIESIVHSTVVSNDAASAVFDIRPMGLEEALDRALTNEERDRLLRLSAEMKVPGRAWLEFEVTGEGNSSTIRQTAIFDPVGFFGLMYWYGLYPLHQLVFGGMLRGIAAAALKVIEQRSIQQQPGTG